MSSETTDIHKVVATLQARIDKLEAEAEVRKLHHKYGYYLDKCLYHETSDLFANHPDTYVQFMNGRFRGKEGIKRLYIDRFSNAFVQGRNGPVHGFLLDHLQAQDIVDYFPAEDGVAGRESPKCKARFRALMSAGNHMSMDDGQLPRSKRQWWEGGLYENEYIKEDGVWKVSRLRCTAYLPAILHRIKLNFLLSDFPFWHGTAEHGWQFTPPDYVPPFAKTREDGDPLGPDELLKHDERLWPDTRVVPFHYAHPVTGEKVAAADPRAPPLG